MGEKAFSSSEEKASNLFSSGGKEGGSTGPDQLCAK